MTIRHTVFFAALTACAWGGNAVSADAVSTPATAAVHDTGRPPWDIDRDAKRKPDQVVAFAGIKPGMAVADFLPGDGYYTRILSPLVGTKGKVFAIAGFPAGYRDAERFNEANRALVKQGKDPMPNPIDPILEIQNIDEYSNVKAMLEILYQYDGQFSAPAQLDAVVSVDAYHLLHSPALGTDKVVPAIDKAIFASLKPGGVFIVADYSAAKGAGFSQATSARSEADAVKAEVLSAGFVLDGESNALANAGDNRASAVTQATKDSADQFLLRFKKPANAPSTDKRPAGDGLAGYYGNTEVMNRGHVDATPQQERRMFYHANGTYQEFGPSVSLAPMQAGLWYWDAAGHNCMLHQYPAAQRGFIVCHSVPVGHNVGDAWDEAPGGTGPIGTGQQKPTPFTVLKGYDPFIR